MLLEQLDGVYLLMAQLMYGAGLRLSECLSLRVKDLDFDQKLIIVCDSKGKKDRRVPLPDTAVDGLRRQLAWRKSLHDRDMAEGAASVYLPRAIDRKYPNAHKELRWQFLFASRQRSKNPRSGRMHRHHMHEGTFPSRLKPAVERAGILKRITSHAFRHSFATQLLQDNTDIRQVQELLGHKDVKTTMIYLHCLNDAEKDVVSPLDRLHELQNAEKTNGASEGGRPQLAGPAQGGDLHAPQPEPLASDETGLRGQAETDVPSLSPDETLSGECATAIPSGADGVLDRVRASVLAMLRRPRGQGFFRRLIHQ
ncbi:integron integrase [Stieleria sp.]|uniref:integron integrase n=1 Tax=Stieleria sp. TaxID=2795976 RepID=UPI00356A1D9F